MNCTQIGSKSFHFYFEYEQCYGLTWILSFIFSIIFMKLKRMNDTQRGNKNNILNSFVCKYKPQFYYWEYIIFIRRIFIALFSVSVSDGMLTFIFVIILLLFLLVHIEYEPFLIHGANKLEGILLCCLISVVVLQGLSSIKNGFKSIIISLFIFIPFILVIYYIYKFVKIGKNREENNKFSVNEVMDQYIQEKQV